MEAHDGDDDASTVTDDGGGMGAAMRTTTTARRGRRVGGACTHRQRVCKAVLVLSPVFPMIWRQKNVPRFLTARYFFLLLPLEAFCHERYVSTKKN